MSRPFNQQPNGVNKLRQAVARALPCKGRDTAGRAASPFFVFLPDPGGAGRQLDWLVRALFSQKHSSFTSQRPPLSAEPRVRSSLIIYSLCLPVLEERRAPEEQ